MKATFRFDAGHRVSSKPDFRLVGISSPACSRFGTSLRRRLIQFLFFLDHELPRLIEKHLSRLVPLVALPCLIVQVPLSWNVAVLQTIGPRSNLSRNRFTL